MPTLETSPPFIESTAVISPDDRYRYSLTRVWDDVLPHGSFVMLNPSTADATQPDPTIRRCIGFARSWGWGGFTVVNLFALRATDPAEMLSHTFPVGPENNTAILGAIGRSRGNVVAAWGGSHRKIKERAFAVRVLVRNAGAELRAIKLSSQGVPCHPLYLPGDLTPIPYPHPEV